MERKTESEASMVATLPTLNNHCLYKILRLLGLEDCMSLAETCLRLEAVYHCTLEKFKEFEINQLLTDKGNDYIERILYHRGRHLTTLIIRFSIKEEEHVLSIAKKNCVNLKSLEMNGFPKFETVQTLSGFNNLELLTLRSINSNDEDFFGTICNLKFLSIEYCRLHKNALNKCLQRNPNIVNFLFYGEDSDSDNLHLELQSLPNLECIYLRGSFEYWNISPLSQMDRLTSLTLGNIRVSNLNDVLLELSGHGILKELELWSLKIDENTFVALKLFDNLEFLVLKLNDFKWNSSFCLPPHLTDLRFCGFTISTNQIASLIQQLQDLTNFILEYSETAINIGSILEELSCGMDCNVENPTLNVVFVQKFLCRKVIQSDKQSQITLFLGVFRCFRSDQIEA